MTPAPDTHILLRAFCDELARCGMRAACTSPGSRCSPLVIALAGEERLRLYSHIDERAAGFFAVGHASATGRPVAVACTSGTAAAELGPAVIEAWESAIPMIVLSADRPPELRDIGAGQSIDQIKLYGTAVKWFFEVGTHEASAERVAWMRTLACRSYWTALEGRPGPVHLNWPLREPLVPGDRVPPPPPGRAGGRPWVARTAGRARLEPIDAQRLTAAVRSHPRGVVVAGRGAVGSADPEALARACLAAGYPLLADPQSGARRGPAAIAHYDALLRHAPFTDAHGPDLILRLGEAPTSKPLRQWLAHSSAEHHWALDPHLRWQDPDARVDTRIVADPGPLLDDLARELDGSAGRDEWLAAWRRADERAAQGLSTALGAPLSEPAVAVTLARELPPEATLFVASSMPVRDVETFWPVLPRPPRVLSNRGANGIDGTVSSALGVAAAAREDRASGEDDGPVVLLIGDVALAHDVGGLLAVGRLGLSVTIVVVNNDGGGIFEFLPVAGRREIFEEHVATPHGLDFSHAARLYGLDHRRVGEADSLARELRRALNGPATIIEVRTDRSANVALHRGAFDEVARALG